MDTRESKTREEEKEHMLSERMPADINENEPMRQTEARKKPGSMPKLLLIVIGVVIVVWLAFIVFSRI